MSTHWIIVFPDDPYFVPDAKKAEKALDLLKILLPDASEIRMVTPETVEFVNAGGNSGTISCPICRQEVDYGWWSDTAQAAYENGFQNLEVAMPCCGAKLSLNDLEYDWPEGFASWYVEARNPYVYPFPEEHAAQIAESLQHPIRVVYRRI